MISQGSTFSKLIAGIDIPIPLYRQNSGVGDSRSVDTRGSSLATAGVHHVEVL